MAPLPLIPTNIQKNIRFVRYVRQFFVLLKLNILINSVSILVEFSEQVMCVSISANQVTIFQNLHNVHNAIEKKLFILLKLTGHLSQRTHLGYLALDYHGIV